MHRFGTIVSTLLLAACGSADDEGTAAGSVAKAAPRDAAAASLPGTYEIKSVDGSIVTEVIKPDGTYTDTRDGSLIEAGRWRVDGAKVCFDPDGSDPEQCHAAPAPAADGSFPVIGPDGNPTALTVRKTG